MPDNTIPGLTPATQEVFDQVSRLNCIKEMFLCGGTGQSLQMDHRLSEDLDFELLGLRKERPMLDFGAIIGEIKSIFPDAKEEILGDDHFLVFINQGKVKLSSKKDVTWTKLSAMQVTCQGIRSVPKPCIPGCSLRSCSAKTKTSCGCLRNMTFQQKISGTGSNKRWKKNKGGASTASPFLERKTRLVPRDPEGAC